MTRIWTSQPSSVLSPSQPSRSSENPDTMPVKATANSSTAPMIVSVIRSRTLPITKLGCSRCGSAKTVIRASRSAESQPRPEYSTPTRPMIPAVAADFWMSLMFSSSGPDPIRPGNIDSIAVTRVSWASG